MSEKTDELEYRAIQSHMDEAMYKAKQQANSGLRPKGVCHNCGETLTQNNQLFCDSDCREDYEKRRHANSQRLF